MSDAVSYFYFRNSRYNVTVAYRRNDDGTASYGASFCRPTDQFVKSMGRKIAEGRLINNDVKVFNPPISRLGLHEKIVESISQGFPGYSPRGFTGSES